MKENRKFDYLACIIQSNEYQNLSPIATKILGKMLNEYIEGDPKDGIEFKFSTLKALCKCGSIKITMAIGDLIDSGLVIAIKEHKTITRYFISLEDIIIKQDINYSAYLNSAHWKELRRLALGRAEQRCQICNSDKNLHVHHRTYTNLGHENISDLIVVCASCHGRI